ncbi:RNA polymerase sigma-70 factor [Compostibacter hankyongensis]|uniref:RNA polymerase sigma-70 factor n=1 Tax=Compostibacter hankyongensis TaxID=1007089 RepID=A0ABP8G1E8_9BACT
MRSGAHIPLAEEAFIQLYDAYSKRLYGFILALVHAPAAAEDLTQELFLKLWVNRESLSSVNHIEHYLFAMARNKALNYIRKAQNDERVMALLKNSMHEAVSPVEHQVAFSEYEQLVGRALERLSPQRSLVFRLSRYQGYDLEEIASRLQLSRNTVKNHLSQALRFIRGYLTDHHFPFLLLLFLLTR